MTSIANSEAGSSVRAKLNALLASVPEVLAADRTYYVRTDGSDSNNGLANTAGGAFLTIQKAADAAMALDFNFDEDIQVTIQVADGTFAEALHLGNLRNMPQNDDPTAYPASKFRKCVAIIGDEASPGNVIIRPGAAGVPVTVEGLSAQWRFSGIKTNCTTVRGSFDVKNGAYAVLRHVHDKNENGSGNFINCEGAHVRVMNDANLSIEGSRQRLAFGTFLSTVFFTPATLTLVAAPNFSIAVMQGSDQSFVEFVIQAGFDSVVGSCTGRMCVAEFNSHITHNWKLELGDSSINICDASCSIQNGFASHGATIFNEAPTALNNYIAKNTGAVWKNTNDGTVKLYYNDAGTLYSVDLTPV